MDNGRSTHGVLRTAKNYARKCRHDEVTPLHVAAALVLPKMKPPSPRIFKEAISESGDFSSFQYSIKQSLDKQLRTLRRSMPDQEELPASASLIEVISRAQAQKSPGEYHLGLEHLILGLIEDPQIDAALKKAVTSASRIKSELERMRSKQVKKVKTAFEETDFHALKLYGHDFIELAGKFDPVIGRDAEIEEVICILSTRRKSNVVLIGEPGVGKSAVVEGLAQRIVRREVPSDLLDVHLIGLDLGAVHAGTQYRGELEERLKAVLDEVASAQGKVVLFIDEFHLLLGNNQANGSMDAANLLKPMLARGQFRCIGATTREEFRKYVEKDAAFERRFQLVQVAESSVADTITILTGLKETYEAYHGVMIQDGALVAAAQLSSRYITGRHLPDKAIDLVDMALANKKKELRTKKKSETVDNIRTLKLRRDNVLYSLEEAEKKLDLDRGAELICNLLKIDTNISKLEKEGDDIMLTEAAVTPEDIQKVVSRRTGIEVTTLGRNEKERLLGLADRLRQRVFGQDQAIDAVSTAVQMSRAGMSTSRKPTGSFLFVGPSGVGKTELARALAEQLFDDEDLLIRFDMSEYNVEQSVSRLIGAPPGYVGYREGGQLTEKVRRRPYSVILFDEVEKAHVKVFNVLLQVLDYGRLTDNEGRKVDFRNTVIIMTSNLGAEHVLDHERVLEEVRRHFKTEFLNRIDNIVVFNRLSDEQTGKVARNLMKGLAESLAKEKGIALHVSNAALEIIISRSYNEKLKQYGARPIGRWIKEHVLRHITDMWLKDEISANSDVYIKVGQGKDDLVFSTNQD